MKDVSELLEQTQLEQIELNIFRGQSHNVGSPNIFGGQILAQALDSAIQTVPEDRVAHSFHGYFILPGDFTKPVIFEVERIRDGGSFSTRRIVAIQNGRAIFNSSASFQLRQEGMEHQIDMPTGVPLPEKLVDDRVVAEQYAEFIPKSIRKYLEIPRPIEFRPVEIFDYFKPESLPPFRNVWIRARGKMGDNFGEHQKVLAYASDYNLLSTSILPHQHEVNIPQLQMASLDHAMWFHRDFRVDEWLLYSIDSPSASNARGFTRGNFFTQEGKLVASVVQEGLIRKKRKKKA
ncbi:MAG: acyl-CoA thioesterase-2 [Maribacter sp.]|jgi:acyl-CoA thioesterase-2